MVASPRGALTNHIPISSEIIKVTKSIEYNLILHNGFLLETVVNFDAESGHAVF